MKPKGCGWTGGGTVYHGCYRTVIIGDKEKFIAQVEHACEIVRGKIRAGELTSRGEAKANSIWSLWLEDYVNFCVWGDWAPYDPEKRITHAHVAEIAKALGWPERWRKRCAQYCVLRNDLWAIDEKLGRGRIK